MGIFDNLKNKLGGKKDALISGATRAPSQVLKENGIDPSGLMFAFGSDGTVTVSGQVKQEADKARIRQVLSGIPGIKQVKQELTVATAAAAKPAEAPAESPLPGPTASRPRESSPAAPADTAPSANTYTVQPGDTLWKISKQVYGEGSKYMQIFEANQGILKSPDHILPGQNLVIPEK